MTNSYAAVLVGGKGKRLGSLTKKIPKPLIKINNKEFLKYLLYLISTYDFKKIFLICSYKSNRFFKTFHKKTYFNSQIICLKEKSANDTGGALFELKKRINSNFFLFNGDSIFSLSSLNINKLKHTNKIINIALTEKNNYLGAKKVFFHFGHENTWIRIRSRIRIRIDLKCWIRIRIEINTDPKH